MIVNILIYFSIQYTGSRSGSQVQNHSSVDKVAKKKSSDMLTDNDWTVNEDNHTAISQAHASNISQPINDTEISRPKKLPELASGEPSRDKQELRDLAVEEEENSRGWSLPYTPCLKKTVQNYFCQNFVKFPPIVKNFGTEMAKKIS